MATNGITSSKVPRSARGNTGNTKMLAETLDLFEGDAIYEQANGERGMLSAIEANEIDGLSATQQRDLLRQAGLRVNYGLTNQ